MDLNTVDALVRPEHRGELPVLQPGDAFLAGGTWLFSEPQRQLRRLIDLGALAWAPITDGEHALELAATCTFAELDAFAADAGFAAAPLLRQCCRSLWGSFKIWNAATVGGNLCLALPASPIAALVVALDGMCTIWCPDGSDRRLPASELILGPQGTALSAGEVLRGIDVPRAALHGRYAFRQASLTEAGRSATLVIGRASGSGLALTVTASTRRPLQFAYDAMPEAAELAAAIEAKVAASGSWFDDVHGAPDWRRHMTLRMAEEIRVELLGAGATGSASLTHPTLP